jgi:hypothetical protein
MAQQEEKARFEEVLQASRLRSGHSAAWRYTRVLLAEAHARGLGSVTPSGFHVIAGQQSLLTDHLKSVELVRDAWIFSRRKTRGMNDSCIRQYLYHVSVLHCTYERSVLSKRGAL